MKIFRSKALFFIGLLFLTSIGVAAYGNYLYQTFISQPIGKASTTVVLEIKKGDTAAIVAQKLHHAGLMAQPGFFRWYLRYQKKEHLIKAGEISLSGDLTVDELIERLIKGQTVQYPVTLIAGQTFKQTLDAIAKLPKLKRELDFDDVAALQALFAIEKPISVKYPYANLEGLLLPETYYYQQGDSDKKVLLRAFEAMQATLEKAWQTRRDKLPISTPYEALILASIVEKETGVAEERPLIAGVFENRMKRNMRLQTDPTVIYGIGMDYDGNIRKKDLREKTDYNTYQIDGLPPTPIALPSKEAILAVVNPQETKALYFVAKGGGEHYFSETLQEHNRAVRKYLLSK